MIQLTTTEQAIYDLLIEEGTRTRDISSRLHLSPHTVERKIEIILSKYGVKTQKELIVKHYKEIKKGVQEIMSEFIEALTPREKEVYCKIVNNLQGKHYKELAKEMYITYTTFLSHLNHIFQKTGTSSQIELIVKHYHKQRSKK